MASFLAWDATCPDTVAPSYIAVATSGADTVVAQAEERKYSKYCHLDTSHIFIPVAIETLGAFRPRTTKFLRELGHRLRLATGESKAAAYLRQRLSVAKTGY